MREEIVKLIKIPAVLKASDGMPIEFIESQKKRKIASREIKGISPKLINYVLSHGGNISHLQKFSSGNIVNFINSKNIYQ